MRIPAAIRFLVEFLILILVLILTAPPSALAQTATKVPPPSSEKLTFAQALANPTGVLAKLSVPDLTAALQDAQANNDTTTVPCWTALLAAAQAQQNAATAALPSGVFSAIQKARDLKIGAANLLAPNGPLSQLNIACAPLLMDVNNTLLALGVSSGIVVGSGGLSLPALPGMLSILLAAPK